MKTYEWTFIISSTLDDDQTKSMIDEIKSYLESQGAEVTNMIVWGKRKLAYLINKQTHGYYVIFTLNMEPDSKTIQKIEQYYRQHDNVLRTMPVRIDKKIASEEEEKPKAEKEEPTTQEPAAPEHEDETDKEKEKSGSEQKQDTNEAL